MLSQPFTSYFSTFFLSPAFGYHFVLTCFVRTYVRVPVWLKFHSFSYLVFKKKFNVEQKVMNILFYTFKFFFSKIFLRIVFAKQTVRGTPSHMFGVTNGLGTKRKSSWKKNRTEFFSPNFVAKWGEEKVIIKIHLILWFCAAKFFSPLFFRLLE